MHEKQNSPDANINKINDDLLVRVQELHEKIDLAANSTASELGNLLVCQPGCSECCMDDLTVFTVEAALIKKNYSEFLQTAESHAEGACAFLNSAGECRIYPHRPYVCRTQGLPLRWLDQDESGNTVEYRDICPVNERVFQAQNKAVVELPQEHCWTLGQWEGALASLQAEATQGELVRVSLRSLFSAK